MRRPLVFVAGPCDGPDILANVTRAVEVSDMIVAGTGAVTFIPHLAVLHQLISPRTRADWLAWGLELLARCDALYRIDGPSPGADAEVDEAVRLGIPVFWSMVELKLWAQRREIDGVLGAA